MKRAKANRDMRKRLLAMQKIITLTQKTAKAKPREIRSKSFKKDSSK